MTILRTGQQLGPYRVEGLLGTGGMAEVYRATHQTLERPSPLKSSAPHLTRIPTFPLRFLREAKAVARLSHPNIITVYDFGEQGRLAYMVMEIAEGGTFRERAARLGTLAEAVAELTPIADALAYAHGKGIVHRDLKPINLLLTEEERRCSRTSAWRAWRRRASTSPSTRSARSWARRTTWRPSRCWARTSITAPTSTPWAS